MVAEDRGPLVTPIRIMLALHVANPIPEYDRSKTTHSEKSGAQEGPMRTVWIYVDTSKHVGGRC